MNVLFISLFYPPNHPGGTETYTHGLAKGLKDRGHQVQVLCVEDWEVDGSYWNNYTDDVYAGVPVRRLHLNWTKAQDPNRYLYDNPIISKALDGYLAEWQPDLVHVTSCQTLSASVIRTAKRAGLPVVVTLTDFWFICPRVTLLTSDGHMCDGQVSEEECLRCLMSETKTIRWSKRVLSEATAIKFFGTLSHHGNLTRFPGLRGTALDIWERRSVLHQTLQEADRVLIASLSARNLFQQNGFLMPIDIVPYGHDLSWLDDLGKTPSDFVRFGFIGQIAPMKGPQLLIEAFRKANQNRQAKLLIYGDMAKEPDFGQHLRALAADCPDIEFRGTYPHTDSAKVFSEIDILVVPSLWHDYPLIINEAFASGTPVIASNVGGMSEFVIHEVNGLLTERGNVDDLSCQLSRVIHEPGLLALLQKGIQPVKRMDEAVSEMLTIYGDLLALPQQPQFAGDPGR